MSERGTPPFERSDVLDKPGIVGARWWQESLATADPIARRQAIRAMLIASAAIAGFGALLAIGASGSSGGGSSDDAQTGSREALQMQREYGWSFGATSESLVFDGETTQPFDRSALARMPADLAPAQARLRPWASPTLFQSPTALPTKVPEGDPGTVTPLKDALRPIFSPAMDKAYRRGKALASLFDGTPLDRVVIVDLPGPEAVAFAAGMADSFDPVFTFDNWPHPRGVVKAHLTLAAAAYYQPLFAKKGAARRVTAPAVLVLDRARLTPYTDEASQFDNRWVAKLPSAAALRELGVKRALYVAPTAADTLELDDINDDFVLYASGGIDVKMVAATDFGPDPTRAAAADEPYFYGNDEEGHLGFWKNYPWNAPQKAVTRVPVGVSNGYTYTPRPRSTFFNGSARPAGFGMVPVIIAAGTGAILGAKLSRSGSWNRSSGSWGG